MIEESDARIERLEKASQDQQGQMVKMMKMLRTLVREKAQTAGPSPQNETAHHKQKREEKTYPDRKSTRLNSSHFQVSRMPSSA